MEETFLTGVVNLWATSIFIHYSARITMANSESDSYENEWASIGNSIVEIRRSYDRLISTMEFPMLVRCHLYIESGSRLNLASGQLQPNMVWELCSQQGQKSPDPPKSREASDDFSQLATQSKLCVLCNQGGQKSLPDPKPSGSWVASDDFSQTANQSC